MLRLGLFVLSQGGDACLAYWSSGHVHGVWEFTSSACKAAIGMGVSVLQLPCCAAEVVSSGW